MPELMIRNGLVFHEFLPLKILVDLKQLKVCSIGLISRVSHHDLYFSKFHSFILIVKILGLIKSPFSHYNRILMRCVGFSRKTQSYLRLVKNHLGQQLIRFYGTTITAPPQRHREITEKMPTMMTKTSPKTTKFVPRTRRRHLLRMSHQGHRLPWFPKMIQWLRLHQMKSIVQLINFIVTARRTYQISFR